MNFIVENTFNGIKESHLRIINSILDLIDEKDEKDPFRTASIIIFLAGIDKIFSLTLIFLWIATKIKAKEIAKHKRTLEKLKAGYISCDCGFLKKLKTLKKLGIDLEDFVWLSELRNHFIHGHNLLVRYRASPNFEHNKINLCPQINFTVSGSFNIRIDQNTLNKWYNEIINRITTYLYKTDFKKRFSLLSKKINNLPINPEPYYSKFKEVLSSNECDKAFEKANDIINELNLKYISLILKKLGLMNNED